MAIGLALMRRAPLGASAFSSGIEPAVLVEQLLRPVAAHPLLQQLQVGRVLATSASGIWCARQKPSTLWPSTFRGAVQPLGLRRTIIGQRGRIALPAARGLFLDACRISSTQCSSVAAIAWCMLAGSLPSTKYGV